MKNQELAILFFREISKITDDKSSDDLVKIDALYKLLNKVFIEITRDEKLQFTTMFARISFACQKFSIEKQTQFYIHIFRKAAKEVSLQPSTNGSSFQKEIELGLKVVADCIVAFYHQVPPQELAEILPTKINYKTSPVEVKAFKPNARIVVFDLDEAKEQLVGRDEATPTQEIRV